MTQNKINEIEKKIRDGKNGRETVSFSPMPPLSMENLEASYETARNMYHKKGDIMSPPPPEPRN